MKTIIALAMVLGTGTLAAAYPSQPHATKTRAMVEHQHAAPMWTTDGSGYDGQGSRTGGPVGGLPNRN